jgi:hypothetical protein
MGRENALVPPGYRRFVHPGYSAIRGAITPPISSAESKPFSTAAMSPASGDKLAGRWQVSYAWGCAGYSETIWVLVSGGVFSSPDVRQEGTCILDGDSITLTYPQAPFVIYTGTVDMARDSMEGTMAGQDGSRVMLACPQTGAVSVAGRRAVGIINSR